MHTSEKFEIDRTYTAAMSGSCNDFDGNQEAKGKCSSKIRQEARQHLTSWYRLKAGADELKIGGTKSLKSERR